MGKVPESTETNWATQITRDRLFIQRLPFSSQLLGLDDTN